MTSNTPLPSSFDGDTDFYEENRWQKFSRRLKEEPLIPLGCLLTCWALMGATRSIRSGDHNRTNRMFRARIYAQGFTLVAMVAGSMYWQTDRQKRKEFDLVVAEKKAREKNEAWIKELEARDEEDKEIKAAREARRKGKVEMLEGKAKELTWESKGIVEEVSNKTDEIVNEEAKTTKSVLDSVRELIAGGKK